MAFNEIKKQDTALVYYYRRDKSWGFFRVDNFFAYFYFRSSPSFLNYEAVLFKENKFRPYLNVKEKVILQKMGKKAKFTWDLYQQKLFNYIKNVLVYTTNKERRVNEK